MRLKNIRLLLLGLGVLLFIGIIYKIGPSVILQDIAKLKWGFLLVVILYTLIYLFDTLGWRFAFIRDYAQMGFKDLFLIRLAGESINYVVPLGSVGGEPLKAHLLKKNFGIPMLEGIASVVIAKTTLVIAEIIFVIAGLVVTVTKFELPFRYRWGLGSLILIGMLSVLIFFLRQRQGLFSVTLRYLKSLKIAPAYLTMREDKIKELDHNIASFYSKSKDRFLLSLSFHLLGWVLGTLEVYVILLLLGIDCPMMKAFCIEAVVQLIRACSFIVPANIGTQEGASLIIFVLLGFGAVTGLTLSLIRRLREVVWAGLGLIILWIYG